MHEKGFWCAQEFQVHLIDQRNHGRSFHEQAFTYELLAEDLYDYIQHYQLEQIYLIGHSMGGKTAMTFATQYPDLVEKLILVDISPKAYPPNHNTILAGLNSIDFSIQNSRKLVDAKLSEYITDWGVRQFLLKNVYWREKGVLDFRCNLKSLTDNNNQVGKALESSAYFDKPTLFLKGERSDYILEEDDLIINRHFPKYKLVEIAKSGHWLHAENPKAFYEEVISFLK